ncbi:MAG: ribulose-phosphate 3-epimerase [Candidatus Nanopelagicales bacterium]|nr:ribulose-phosphate 3-epimerase [Candidatus Nanopelagicales bacterium]MCF8538813.1 ribulose-phosphate 3-epimerase [Candidatus Nanopelagicales bacterium]MCF8550512.1 ribulose-phosphate 3-epimerase [Candidatus Nanopelagicales bacterium]
MLISPSVLNSNLGRLSAEISLVDGVADMIHLDVMDNHFVPNLTFGLPVVRSVIEQTSLRADVHLMIDDPDRWAPGYAEAGAFSVTFHIEAAREPVSLAQNIRSAGARAAVALKPGTDIDAIAGVVPFVDMILIMTVEPGFGGQAFMRDMLPKVRRARELTGADMWIEVDGGVSADTIVECRDAGANVFVAGSSVYGSIDPAAEVMRLSQLVHEG